MHLLRGGGEGGRRPVRQVRALPDVYEVMKTFAASSRSRRCARNTVRRRVLPARAASAHRSPHAHLVRGRTRLRTRAAAGPEGTLKARS